MVIIEGILLLAQKSRQQQLSANIRQVSQAPQFFRFALVSAGVLAEVRWSIGIPSGIGSVSFENIRRWKSV